MADETFDVGFRGKDEGFGGAARAAVAEIGKIRGAINSIPTTAISGLGSQLAAVFSVSYLKDRIKESIDYGSTINDMAQRVGVSTAFIQEMNYAAEQSGGNIRAVTMGIRDLQRSQAAALTNPKGEDAKAFGQLGISMATLKNTGIEDLFRRVAAAIGEGDVNASRMTSAMTLMGRSASTLLPMMQEGLAGLAEQFNEIGGAIDDGLIQKLDEAGDKMHSAGVRAKSGWAWLGGKTATGYNAASDWVDRVVQGTIAAFDKPAGGWSGTGLMQSVAQFKAAYESTGQGQDQAATASAAAKELRRSNAGRGAGMEISERGSASSSAYNRPSADALQRIGLFIGGSGSPMDIARRQLTAAERLLEENRKIVDLMRSTWE